LDTGLAISQGLKPVYAVHVGEASWPVYIGLIALVVNIAVTYVVSLVTRRSVALSA
jgi:SSS family solute:Na+ symporter